METMDKAALLFTADRAAAEGIFDIKAAEPLSQTPERTGLSSENRGVIGRAMSSELREAFLTYRARKISFYNKEFEAMSSYISSPECSRDLGKLLRREYTMPPPLHKRVPKNMSGRKRDIYTWQGPVKYMLKLLSFAIRDFDSMFSDGLYSFRTSQSAKDFLLKIRNYKSAGDCYIVKADVSNYVSSIVPELIIPMLEKLWADDPAFLDLMKFLLLRRECIERDGSVVSCEPGGLGGIPIANLFMNVYLMELDDYFYARSPLYCRYSDDIIIFAHTRDEAEGYLDHLLKVLERLKLKTNPEKTYLIAPGEEVDILGCRYKGGEMDISEHAKAKIKRKIRMRAGRLLKLKRVKGLSDEECAKILIQYCSNIFFGNKEKNDMTWARWIFPVITGTASLKELDHYVQDAVRYVICGSMSDKRYRITYRDLQDLGYRSLVHAYYHFEGV